MRRALALFVLIPAAALAGCLSGIEESRLEREAREVPLPEGAMSVNYTSGCSGGCWSSSNAFGHIRAEYPGGTNVSILRVAFDDVLSEDGWTITESSEPNFWYDNGTRTSGAGIAARKEGILLSCFIGQTLDLRVLVPIGCYVARD